MTLLKWIMASLRYAVFLTCKSAFWEKFILHIDSGQVIFWQSKTAATAAAAEIRPESQ